MSASDLLDNPVPTTYAQGLRAAAPVVLGYMPIGFAFGVLARTSGFSVAEVGLMSLLLYAGSGQFIGTSMIAAGSAPASVISTIFLINLRHLLMSAALVPSLGRNKAWQNSLLAHEITDETFAVNTAILQGRPTTASFVAGLHNASHLAWFSATVTGALVGQVAGNTEALGLDFALPAMFVGLLVPNLRGPGSNPRRASALVAAAIAVAIGILVPGASWSVIVATLVAATVGVILE